MTIQELISASNLSPSDIVKLSGGRIRMNQASLWLRKMNFSLPTEIMLEYMCKEKDANGVESGTVGRPSLSGKKERPDVMPSDAILQSIKEKRVLAGKKVEKTPSLAPPKKVERKVDHPITKMQDAINRPDAEVTSNIPVAMPMKGAWGLNMTYKKSYLDGRTQCLKFNIDGAGWYLIDTNAKSFSAGGKVYSVSDFKEVE